jgi:hypothetical protein
VIPNPQSRVHEARQLRLITRTGQAIGNVDHKQCLVQPTVRFEKYADVPEQDGLNLSSESRSGSHGLCLERNFRLVCKGKGSRSSADLRT